MYLLAASSDGDQTATFEAGSNKAQLNIENWGGFIGQWYNREWSTNDYAHDNYGQMTGLQPAYLKRADLAWYASHHHDAAGKNIAYAYSYLFAYGMDLPAGATTLRLPNNPRIRIFAVSVAKENAPVPAAQPLYDELPSTTAGSPDFTLDLPAKAAVSVGKSSTARVLVLPRGTFHERVTLSVSGLPAGVTAAFAPATTASGSILTLTAPSSAAPVNGTLTITTSSNGTTHTAQLPYAVRPVLAGTVPVDLASAANVMAIYSDGSKFADNKSADNGGYAFSGQTLGGEQIGGEVTFRLGAPNANDAVSSTTVPLPAGSFSSLRLLATAVDGSQAHQVFTLHYTDGTSTTVRRNLSDWSAGDTDTDEEQAAVHLPYRLAGDGTRDGGAFTLFAYRLPVVPDKQLQSLTLPSNRNVIVLAATLVPAAHE